MDVNADGSLATTARNKPYLLLKHQLDAAIDRLDAIPSVSNRAVQAERKRVIDAVLQYQSARETHYANLAQQRPGSVGV